MIFLFNRFSKVGKESMQALQRNDFTLLRTFKFHMLDQNYLDLSKLEDVANSLFSTSHNNL